MTPVYINDRGLIPVYDGDEEVYEALHVLARIEGKVAEGAASLAGVNMTSAMLTTPRHLVRWYNYEALQISKCLGSLARLELHLRLSQHQSVK
jgi:hypothetical protein